jgi:hypothetical protein
MSQPTCLQALHHAVYATLTADTLLSSLITTPIVDRIPETIDASSSVIVTIAAAGAQRTRSSGGRCTEQATLAINLFSRKGSRKPICYAIERITAILDMAALDLGSGFHLISLRAERSEVRLLGDNVTHMGTLRLSGWVEVLDT